MRPPPHPLERERLETLHSYDVLDTPREADFDDLVALAAEVCGTPISLVSLIDENRQWFKAAIGVDLKQTSLDVSVCVYGIQQGDLFEVPDATSDTRFQDNPLVVEGPRLRFYAGVPLHAENGLPLGMLCVLDTVPRELTASQRRALRVLGRQVMNQLEMRRKLKELETERAISEMALTDAASTAKLLKTVTDRLPVRIAYIDRDLRYQFVNDAYEQGLGIPADELLGKTITEAANDEILALTRTALERSIQGEVRSEEVVIPYSDTVRRIQATFVPDFDETGAVTGVVSHVMDVTEQRRIEEAIQEQREHQDQMLETAQVATFDWDIVYDRVFGNRLLSHFFGMKEGVVAGLPLTKFLASICAEDVAAVRSAIEASVNTGGKFEAQYRLVDAEGIERTVLARGETKLDSKGSPLRLSGVVLDISERVASEQALRTSEERFRQLVELSPSTVWFGEIDGSLSYISQDFYETTGLAPGQAMPSGWTTRVHPDDLDTIVEAWTVARRDGTPYDTEMRIRHRDGVYRWISARALPVRDAEGRILGWLGSNNDIHENKAIEETLRSRVEERTQELEAALREAEGFNYSISHDLRSPLRAISATSNILLEEAASHLGEEHRSLLERQAHNANRLGRLIDELLRLSRLSRVEVKRSPLNITTKTKFLVSEMTTSCKIVIQEGMTAEGDPGLVRTVIQNLLDNACKFSPPESTVTVGQSNGVFFIRDEGIGLDVKYAPRIFLPFERLVLDSEFPGTGIGLANVKRIVERHGGRVWVESTPGQGATFFFTLGEAPRSLTS